MAVAPARSTTARGAKRRTWVGSRSSRSSRLNRIFRSPWVELPYGDFAVRLLASRFTYTPTTRFFVSSLIQFNADAHTLNFEPASALGISARQRTVRGL